MKTLKSIMLALMLGATTTALAQFANSTSKTSGLSSQNIEPWNSFSISYNPLSISPDHGDNISLTGFSAVYGKTWKISNSAPLFIEGGLGVQYAFGKEDTGTIETEYGSVTSESKYSLLTAKVPVNIMYAIAIPNSKVTIAPFAGLTANVHIVGTQKNDISCGGQLADYEDEVKHVYEDEYGEDFFGSKNLFDKKDMGSSDACWNRFMLGAQVGANVYFGTWYLGASYGFGLTELAKKTKMNAGSISVGFKF